MTRLLCLALLILPTTAQAADRTIGVGSYDSVRIEGPFDVRIASGGSPGATISGDHDTIEGIDIETVGTTLIVKRGSGGWGETPARAAASPTVITLTTPALATLQVTAGAKVSANAMKGQDVRITVAGGGAVTVGAMAADRAVIAQQGTGTLTLAGTALRARIVSSGAGAIDAGALVANDLIVNHDGLGDLHAAARYTADVTNTGLGSVTIDGKAKCVIRGQSAGPVRCGVPSR